jgi:hypothetical protein
VRKVMEERKRGFTWRLLARGQQKPSHPVPSTPGVVN